MRKKIIAGNWKMNKTPSEAVALINELKPLVANDEVDVVFCVPAIDIIPAMEAAKGTNIQIGAENMYFEEKGAFTGEISPNMLTDAGVILHHPVCKRKSAKPCKRRCGSGSDRTCSKRLSGSCADWNSLEFLWRGFRE